MLNRGALLICTTTLAVLPAAAQQHMYKCVDAKGKVYYTQIPPQECLGRETRELNKSGTLLRRNEAALTPEQIRARDAERKKKLADEEKAKDELRKNQALLNTYSNEKDIDDARARALADADAAIKDMEKNIAGAQKRQKALEAEKEFYAKKTLPPKLVRDIENIETEIKTQNELLDAKKKEISVINAKYDEEKRRYIELTKGKGGAPSTAASAKK